MSLKKRRQKRKTKSAQSKLNLVALMDIFTILVFFLMVNSSEVQVMQSDKKVELPKSTAKNVPKENLVLIISQTDLVLQGRPIVKLNQVSRNSETIDALEKELNYQAARNASTQKLNKTKGLPITVFGDQEVPYYLLRQILATCTKSNFRDVSLAVKYNLPKKPAGTPLSPNHQAKIPTEPKSQPLSPNKGFASSGINKTYSPMTVFRGDDDV